MYQQSFLNRDSFLNRAFLNRDSTVLTNFMIQNVFFWGLPWKLQYKWMWHTFHLCICITIELFFLMLLHHCIGALNLFSGLFSPFQCILFDNICLEQFFYWHTFHSMFFWFPKDLIFFVQPLLKSSYINIKYRSDLKVIPR